MLSFVFGVISRANHHPFVHQTFSGQKRPYLLVFVFLVTAFFVTFFVAIAFLALGAVINLSPVFQLLIWN